MDAYKTRRNRLAVFRKAQAHQSNYVLLHLNRIVDTGEEKIHEQNENGRYH
jgi:hypothetical protein